MRGVQPRVYYILPNYGGIWKHKAGWDTRLYAITHYRAPFSQRRGHYVFVIVYYQLEILL